MMTLIVVVLAAMYLIPCFIFLMDKSPTNPFIEFRQLRSKKDVLMALFGPWFWPIFFVKRVYLKWKSLPWDRK